MASEEDFIVNEVAFGVIGSVSTLQSRVFLLKHWWLPGAVGCLYVERGLPRAMERKVPFGLELCFTHEALRSKPWYKDDARATVRGAVIALVVLRKFPGRKWYVIGDDDTMFSPLALAQRLQNFDWTESWYLGTRSENLEQRRALGWDMAFGGGGIVLSGGLLNSIASSPSSSHSYSTLTTQATSAQATSVVERCLDQAMWSVAPGGDWVLHRCLSRLGVPLTPLGGMHQLDSSQLLHTRDVLERHPVQSFLSLHHPSRVFLPSTQGGFADHGAFFRGMYSDPQGFLQLSVCETHIPASSSSSSSRLGGGSGGGFNLTVAISTGLSVRVWPRRVQALLWAQTRSDVASPSPDLLSGPSPQTSRPGSKGFSSSSSASSSSSGELLGGFSSAPDMVRFSLSPVQLTVDEETASSDGVHGFASVTLYTASQNSNGQKRSPAAAYASVVVAEERVEQRWVGAPRKLCHVATHEVSFSSNDGADSQDSPRYKVLLLGLRDCHIPRSRSVKLPSPGELSELVASSGGPTGKFTHTELPSGFNFAP